MNPFIVSSIVTSIVSLVMSFVVFANNRNDRVNQIWALTTFLLGMWSMGLAGVVSSKSQDVAMLWQYLLDASAIIIPITFFIFTAHLLNLQEVYKKTVNLSWVAGILLLILSFTKFFKLGVAPKFSFDYWIVPGPLYSIFPLVFCLFVSFSVYLLLKERTRTKNTVLKRQINYVLGAQIFGFGGGITNFFPQLWDIYPVGNYFVLFYVFFISYSIFKHHLFDIKVIATELFSYAIWVFLLARVLLASTPNERFTNVVLLVIVVIFTVLLIKSVRKEVEQREQLEILTKKLAKANEQLKVLDKARAEFISIASHQLRTPPATIKWYVAAILGGDFGPIPDSVKDQLRKTERVNNGLIRLIDDLLNVSRVERGKLEFMFEKTDIQKLVELAYEQLIPQAAEKKLQLIYNKPTTTIPEITADKEKLRQVVNNLIDNAIKYTKQGSVEVSLSRSNGNVVIKVKDSGKGVSKDETSSIFDKFGRGKDAGKHASGLGLGLYLAKVVVEQHKGKIWVESKGVGKGSTFVVSLPLKTDLQKTEFDFAKH